MKGQLFLINGRIYTLRDTALQEALARIYNTPDRARCMCKHGGIDMYVAKHRLYVVKRMPGTGGQHHATCPSYEPEYDQSGLGQLIGQSIIERSADCVELHVDFPLARAPGRAIASSAPQGLAEFSATRHRMSLRAVMHFLFERAGFNRWTPAMQGKRTQAVLHRYLLEAAEGVETKGVRLFERLYVPEQFREERKTEIAERRRGKLAILQAPEDDVHLKMALVIGEYKGEESSPFSRKIWLRHMPDAPLFVDASAWERLRRAFGGLFEALDADTKTKQRVVMCALIYAKREHVYQIDAASVMLTTENWVPLEGIHEADFIQALTEQRRRFVKPLRYDACSAASFPNALLLDTGASPTPLHVVSALMDPRDRSAKEKAIKAHGTDLWVWHTDKPMPPLPKAATYKPMSEAAVRTQQAVGGLCRHQQHGSN